MNLVTRGRRAAQGIRSAVEGMEVSMRTDGSRTIDRFEKFRARRHRNRRIGAIAVAAAIVVTTVIVVVSTIMQQPIHQTGEPRPITPSEARGILDAVVLPYDEPPPGTELERPTAGASALGSYFDGGVAPRWPRIGFIDARRTNFTALTKDGQRFLGSITSWAAVYENADASATAFARFVNLFVTIANSDPEPIELGEEGWSYAPGPVDLCSRYLWRSGAVIMSLETCGNQAGMLDELAHAMAAGAKATGRAA